MVWYGNRAERMRKVILQLLRKAIDVKEHERLSNITLKDKFKKGNMPFIDVLHFTVTVAPSIMNIAHTIK